MTPSYSLHDCGNKQQVMLITSLSTNSQVMLITSLSTNPLKMFLTPQNVCEPSVEFRFAAHL